MVVVVVDKSGFILRRADAVLVMVDLQDRLLAAMGRKDDVVAASIRLVKGCSHLGIPIIVTEQYPKGLGPTVSSLKDIVPTAIEKISFDCCGEDGFLTELKKTSRHQVILCGSETHICVLQTCVSLLQEGFDVHVIADAVCSRNDGDRDVALTTMRQAGAVVSSVETALFQILGKAGTAEFKEISAIVK